MALQTSGPISFANLQTEFGGTHPITMGEYAEYRVSGSGDTISMDQFYGASAGYIVHQGSWLNDLVRGYNEDAGGSISPYPALYEGSKITVISMATGATNILVLTMEGDLAPNAFTTFTGGGFTLLSSTATINTTPGISSWNWITANAGGFTGSGDLDITIE